jgi:glycosyltransferase involved in cell wall biosynthesis
MSSTFETQKIPRKIHYVFLNKNEKMPEFFSYCVDISKELHPDWDINFYNEDDALQIVKQHFKELEDLYRSFPLDIQRANMFKILLMYLHGGFYMDLDVYCLKSLDPLLKFDLVLGEEKHLEREICTALGLKNPKRIANYMFGSTPKHVFWLDLLNEVIAKSHMEIKNENDISESTGAALLTDFYHLKADIYKDIVLLLNKDRFCLNESHKKIGCHFGDYAAHLHLGTWRWQNGENEKLYPIRETQSHTTTIENSFRYQIENRNYCNFYFNQDIAGADVIYNKHLADAFKKTGKTTNRLTDVVNEKIVLYGPLSRYMNASLTRNTYIYCSNLPAVPFAQAEVDFINQNFTCCVVPTTKLKKHYRQSGITTNVEIIEPGFKRYVRNFGGEQSIKQFTVGCMASSFDTETIMKLIHACENLKKERIALLKVKLYDPKAKFKNLYSDFSKSGLVDYTTVVINEDFFSGWLADLTVGVFGFSDEPWPGDVLEFLYMGIPVIVPGAENYRQLLDGTTVNPAVILVSAECINISENSITIENFEKAILELYQRYDHYNTLTLDTAEILEDMFMIEETEQRILKVLSAIH